MTDRINSFIVVLAKDVREDDVVEITNALRMIKGVLSVAPQVSTLSDHISQERVRYELSKKLRFVLDSKEEI